MKLLKLTILLVCGVAATPWLHAQTPASPRHALVLSIDFIPENMDGLLSIFRTDSKIGPLMERGYVNETFRIQPEGGADTRAVSRAGVYASLWTGVWPSSHGVFGLENDQYQLEKHPQIFNQLKSISTSLDSVVITADQLIGNRLVKGYASNSFIETSNANVVTNAARTISGDPPALLWVHWGFDSSGTPNDGFTTQAYRAASSFKRILSNLWLRDSFADESWVVVIMGLPVADPGLAPDSRNFGFVGVDTRGVAAGSIPELTSAVDLAPWLAGFFSKGGSAVGGSGSADERPVPVRLVSQPEEADGDLKLNPTDLPQTAASLDELTRRIEKLTLAYQQGRDEQQRLAQQQALDFQKRQDELQTLIMTQMSNRLSNVRDMSTSYRKFSGNVMDQSIQLALTVIVVMMVICMGTFVVTTVIQTRNSRQLAQIMQSFAAYRSRQLHREFPEYQNQRSPESGTPSTTSHGD
jgi:hypothetical protein